MESEALSVTTISGYLKQILDNDGLLYRVKVFGEISSYNISNGILYFGLKDENALLNCVMFNHNLTKTYNIGDKVVVQGTPNYYIKGGRLSFNVENIEPLGEGELYKNFLILKEKLSKEGLFDLERKKQLPTDIKRIGVVTSETGAVIQDIINVSTRRNKQIDIVLFPVKVQGRYAENSIAKGIEYFNTSNVDAIIVARGGGSEENLLPFNTEVVVRAIANSSKFVMSAVGHETNYTLVDFVSDMRAPTPSAAAELLVKEQNLYLENFVNLSQKLNFLIKLKLDEYEDELNSIVEKLNNKITKKFDDYSVNLALLIKDLNTKNPLEILEKGYSKIEMNDKRITSVKEVKQGDELKCNLKDGSLIVNVKEIR
ncbi:MAG: exodeoxyribonuclease VII large subunit [Clostridiales bacterium]|nr:exodeoxyribonuclease VII large subunit [Candidatus Apopatousia equi]